MLDLSRFELTSLGRHPGVYSAALHRNVSFVLWSGAATLEGVSAYEQSCARCRKLIPGPMSCVHVIAPEKPELPSSEVRAELNRINSAYADTIVGCAIVIPGSGFVASALRGLVTALMLRTAMPAASEVKIVATPEAAAEWLSPVHAKGTGVSLSAEVLVQAIRLVESQR